MYYLHEVLNFKDIVILTENKTYCSNILQGIRIIYAINGGNWSSEYVVEKKNCRLLEPWEVVKYKLLGYI